MTESVADIPLAWPVVVETPAHAGVGDMLSYAPPLQGPLPQPGQLVRVELGRREVLGIVWGEPQPADPGLQLKPITAVLEAIAPLGADWRQLVQFAAGYYQRGLGEMALSVLPPELKKLTPESLGRKRARKKAPGAGHEDAPSLPPTAEQAEVLAAIRQSRLALPGREDALGGPPVLIWGATGSGKTEIYLQQVAEVLARGEQALVMVPEINLTPQLEARFRERFAGHDLVTQHSGLTPAQRLQHWLAAHRGEADVVLGTRMSVFTPMPRLGLIVVDEEHDPSYKSQDGARYSAKDLAILRAHQAGRTVLLGSATPSLESWHRADEGRYLRLAMPSRVGGGRMPKVGLIDMTHGRKGEMLSPALIQALRRCHERGEQSLVFLNRRGYAPVLHCGECGWMSGCPHCSAWRVFHKLDRTLRCHHCGFTERVMRACPDCGNADLQPMGRGTERLEEQLAEVVPGARVARIDADSTRGKGELEQHLAQVHAGDVDILVGTQMVTKGHDFRRMTLVAAVNPDTALFSSDFRAGERLFAMLLQAAGRAGRDADLAAHSEMLIQTWQPLHPLYQALQTYDYRQFAKATLQERQQANLPPYNHLALLRAEGRSQEEVQAFLNAAAQLLRERQDDRLWISPAVPTPVQRVADLERAQTLIESSQRPALLKALQAAMPEWTALKKSHRAVVRWAIDVDPLSI